MLFNLFASCERSYQKIQNILLMQKYLQDNILLTKEAFEQYIQQQRQSEATQYGLTLEEYNQAILSGSVVQTKP
jgi:hypothetical protein